MEIKRLIEKFFDGDTTVVVATFNGNDVNMVCDEFISRHLNNTAIELSVLQSLNYCLYEVLDNVLTHSTKTDGVMISRYLPDKNQLQMLVADDGIGIYNSLRENVKYSQLSEEDALLHAIMDRVTDGKGMGFGLYATKNLITNAGGYMVIASGTSVLEYDGKDAVVTNEDETKGTIVFLAVNTDKDIDANSVVENRTDCQTGFNETFLDDEDLNKLW